MTVGGIKRGPTTHGPNALMPPTTITPEPSRRLGARGMLPA